MWMGPGVGGGGMGPGGGGGGGGREECGSREVRGDAKLCKRTKGPSDKKRKATGFLDASGERLLTSRRANVDAEVAAFDLRTCRDKFPAPELFSNHVRQVPLI